MRGPRRDGPCPPAGLGARDLVAAFAPMRLLLLSSLLLLPLGLAGAGQPGGTPTGVTLRVGAGRADITPSVEVRNWVSGKPYAVVHDPLLVQALVLDDGSTKAVLLRWDLTDISESLRDEVRARVGRALGIPGGQILLNASHTHSAPWAPVYAGGQRGRERDTWWAIRYMPAQNDYPPYRAWMERLLAAAEEASRAAVAAAVPAQPWIGRVGIQEYLYNRRPRAPAWGVAGKPPAAIGYTQEGWDAHVLQGGASFGPVDRTLALVAFRAAGGKTVATAFHAACHSVSIYPFQPGISADWPAPAAAALSAAFGGESLFFQGCSGDITPWLRGAAAVQEMAAGLARKSAAAAKFAVPLETLPLRFGQVSVDLPLQPAAKARTGTDTVAAEVQVIVCGPLAFVTLPGEPLTDLGVAIRERSPFPQTLVLGYSNGNGVHYVGMPGEKARGGYEMGVAGAGTDECGALLVEAAVRLLRKVYDESGYPRP